MGGSDAQVSQKCISGSLGNGNPFVPFVSRLVGKEFVTRLVLVIYMILVALSVTLNQYCGVLGRKCMERNNS